MPLLPSAPRCPLPMLDFASILSVVLPVYLTMAAGFTVRKTGLMPSVVDAGMMRLCIVLLTPCLHMMPKAHWVDDKGEEKGGLKDQGNAQLLLGISQFNQKNYGAAGEAFSRARGFEKHRKMADGYLQLIKVQKG